MKRILLTSIAAAGLAAPTLLADYTVFRVCEDQHVIKTSDGAEAGHVEYIVVDPAQQRIVSAVLTGGVVSDRFVAVPFSTIQMGSGRNITLTNITRERLVAAPVIERTRLTSSTVIEPSYFERSYTHFGVSGTTGTTVDRTRTDVTIDAADRDRTRTGRDREMRRDAAGTVTTDPGSAATSADRAKTERAKTDTDDAEKPAEARDAEKKAARDADKKADRDATKADRDADKKDTDARDADKKSATENEKEAAKSRSGSRDVKADEEKSTSPGASGATPPKTETSAPGASGSTPAAESGTRTSPGQDAQPGTSPGASGSTPAAKSGVSSKPETSTPPASSSTPASSTESSSTPPSSGASSSSGQSATPPSTSTSSGAGSSDAGSATKPQ